jgi:hypothetical protein
MPEHFNKRGLDRQCKKLLRQALRSEAVVPRNDLEPERGRRLQPLSTSLVNLMPHNTAKRTTLNLRKSVVAASFS